MKKPKQKRRQRIRRKTHTTRLGSRVERLTAQGMSRDLVAHQTGLTMATLRRDYAEELNAGRLSARADRDRPSELTKSERWVLRHMESTRGTPWWPATGSLLYLGGDGKCAKSIASAFLAWRARGVFGTTGEQSETPEQRAQAEKIYREAFLETQKESR
jgi:hypothetical protein